MSDHSEIFCSPPPLAEMIYSTMQAAAPRPILFPDYCGQFVCDRHDETQGEIGPLGLFEIENCLVGPAGVLLSADRQILDTPYMLSRFWRDTIVRKAVHWQSNDLLGRLLSHATDIEMRAIDDVTVVSLVKPGYLVYGHWLLDILPMAWLFRRSAMARTEPVKYLIARRTPPWARKIMEILFGLTEADFLIFDDAREVLQVKRLIQPSLVRRSPILGPAFNDFIEEVLQICGAPGEAAADFPKRLFISRIGVTSTAPLARITVGPEALESIAVANGISVVHPEQMRWVDQVRMLAGAEFVVGEFGSGLHNSIFSNADAVTVTIGNSVMSWTQSAIAGTRGQRLQYFMPRHESRENGRVLIHYDPEAFDACLGQLLALL